MTSSAPARQLVVVRSPGFPWALPAERVRQIVSGGSPFALDVREAVGLPAMERELGRVMVAEIGRRQLSLRVDSPVELVSVPGDSIVPLPALSGGPKLRALVEGLALGEEKVPYVFVLSPRGLEALANEKHLNTQDSGDPR